MKRLIAWVALVVPALVAPAFAASNGTMSADERAYLVEQLELTKKNMLASITGLTQAQWEFKPAPSVWSVKECAEHIVLAEDFLFGATQGILKSPAVDRPANSNAQFDRLLVAGVQDRSRKATAPEPIVPSGKYATPQDAARAFIERRGHSIEYVKSTEDELRIHLGDSPAGKIDAYQFLLLMSSHSARHTAQIKEVQANPDYPKGAE